MTTLNERAAEIHEIAAAHGFWPEGGRNFGEMIALAHSELSEALEEHRDGKPVRYETFHMDAKTSDYHRALADQAASDVREGRGIPRKVLDELRRAGIAKPEGAAVELVDCIIRCLDTLYSLGVNIDQTMIEKMQYNEARAYKHGKAY